MLTPTLILNEKNIFSMVQIICKRAEPQQQLEGMGVQSSA